MVKVLTSSKYIFSGVATFITYLIGGWDYSIIALLIMMSIDYLSGVFVAIANKQVSSEIGFKGIAKKCLILCMVAIGVIVDNLLKTEFELCRMLVIYFYIANEGISILENASNLGLPVPQKLKDALIQIQNKKK